jgi:organic radical activating enzyme
MEANEFITELDNIARFCKKYQQIYIYDNGDKRKSLYRFVRDWMKIDASKIVVLTSESVNEIIKNSTGALIGKMGGEYTDYLALSESAIKKIDYKLRILQPEEFHFEVSLAEHCNLSCQMCDHWSQLAKPKFLDTDTFERDIKRLSQLTDKKIKSIILLGGEPLLNDNILNFVKITKNYFPQGKHKIISNGIKLLKFNNEDEKTFFRTIKENDFMIDITFYPINIDYNAIVEKAKYYDVKIKMNSQQNKISYKLKLDINGLSPTYRALNCYLFNYCRSLKNGHFYTCNHPSNIDIFNNYFDFFFGFLYRIFTIHIF